MSIVYFGVMFERFLRVRVFCFFSSVSRALAVSVG